MWFCQGRWIHWIVCLKQSTLVWPSHLHCRGVVFGFSWSNNSSCNSNKPVSQMFGHDLLADFARDLLEQSSASNACIATAAESVCTQWTAVVPGFASYATTRETAGPSGDVSEAGAPSYQHRG
eukprot:10738398-Lingulodinium_polyedra.AAC.1